MNTADRLALMDEINQKNETTRNACRLNLNPEYIHNADSNSQFDAGSALAREGERIYTSGLEKLEGRADHTDDQRAYLAQRREGWKALCETAYNDMIRRRASYVPWTVAGPANYNAKKNNRLADAAMNASIEWGEKLKAYIANTLETVRDLVPDSVKVDRYRTGKDSRAISADDPLAVEKLTARIEYLKEEHAQNLAMTKYYRKHKTMKGAPGISDENAARLDADLERLPECMRCFGFPSNETATIRRMESRLADLVKQREQIPTKTAETAYKGFSVRENESINRLQIIFDGKPDEETRNTLKANGFRWSPREGAWQRQLTDNARAALRRIAAEIETE